MLMLSLLQNIKQLRKLTGLSVTNCRLALLEFNNDINLASKWLMKLHAVNSMNFSGSWFVYVVFTRFSFYLFKIYANDNVYNNRLFWVLRKAVNVLINSVKVDCESLLNIVCSDGIVIYSCLNISFDYNLYCFYFHNRVNTFLCKHFVMISLSALGVFNVNKLVSLGNLLCKQVFCVSYLYPERLQQADSVLDFIICQPCLYSDANFVTNALNVFEQSNKVSVSVQKVITLF